MEKHQPIMNKLGGLVGRNYRQIWQSSCWFRLNLYVPRTHVPLILNQQKWTILYECTDGSLICSMVYKILYKLETCMFWSQCCIILEWKPLNCIQGIKEEEYGLWKKLFNRSWVGSEHDEWSKITSDSYYIDDILYSIVRSTDPDTEVWIRLVMSSSSNIKVMLDQENYQSWIKDGWLTMISWHVFCKSR